MAAASPSTVSDSTGKGISAPGRRSTQQWRHCYLLLVAVFAVIWRICALPIPNLENIRIMGGLHPFDVLLLMDVLKITWVLPSTAAVLYAGSFAVPKLNTAEAVALTALCSILVLTFILIIALIRISL